MEKSPSGQTYLFSLDDFRRESYTRNAEVFDKNSTLWAAMEVLVALGQRCRAAPGGHQFGYGRKRWGQKKIVWLLQIPVSMLGSLRTSVRGRPVVSRLKSAT